MWIRGCCLLVVLATGCAAHAEAVWRYTAAGAFPGRPALGGAERVYAPADDRHLYAFEPKTGELIWRAYLEERPTGGIAVSTDGTVLLTTRRRSIVAINGWGHEVWRRRLDEVPVGDPAIAEDGTVYVVDRAGGLITFSHHGRLRFRVEACDRGGAVTGPVVLGSGTIVVPCSDATVRGVAPDGSLMWTSVLAGVPTRGAVDAVDRIYVGTDFGSLVSISPDGKILWDHLEESPILPPVLVEDGVVAATAGGVVAKLGFDGEVGWRHETGNRYLYAPVVDVNETVLLLDDDGLVHRIGAGGAVGTSIEITDSSSGFVLSRDGMIYCGTDDWRVYAFESGTRPGQGWSQLGGDFTHAGRAPDNRPEAGTSSRARGEEPRDVEAQYLDALLARGDRRSLEAALRAVAEQVCGTCPRYREFRRILERIAGEGLIRVERTVHRVSNDYPDLRERAYQLLPCVAGTGTNAYIADAISYEYDTYALAAAMRAVGGIGSDPTGDATRAVVRAAYDFIDSSGPGREQIVSAALDCMKGLIAYHGAPPDEIGLDLLLTIFRGDYSREIREYALDVIRRIRYY